MSLIIIAFNNAPVPSPEWQAKDEALNNEIRNKTTGINCLISVFFNLINLYFLFRNF